MSGKGNCRLFSLMFLERELEMEVLEMYQFNNKIKEISIDKYNTPTPW